MTDADYATRPATLRVREVRVTLKEPGLRVRELVLVTTLLAAEKYPAPLLAALFGVRWSAEVNLRHLKQTLGLDVRRSQSVAGVTKELHAFVLISNRVRQVMGAAARRQGVAPNRISFVDALRWLRHARPGDPLPMLVVVPHRPGRHQPREKTSPQILFAHDPPAPRTQTTPRNPLQAELNLMAFVPDTFSVCA